MSSSYLLAVYGKVSIMDRDFDQYDEECEAILHEARCGHVFSAADTVLAHSGDGKGHIPNMNLKAAFRCP